MKKVMASAGLVALGALGVETARGQLLAGAEKPWSVAGTLRGFYDSNYSTGNGTNRQDSFGFEVRPSVSLNLPLDQTSLSLSYIYSMKYYDDRPIHNIDSSHDFELLLMHNFSERYSLDLSDSFVIAQEPELIDRFQSNPTRVNGDNIRNNASVNFHAQVTPLLGFVLGYANTFYDYDQSGVASLSSSLDRMEHMVTLNSRWQIFEETVGVLGYQFGVVDHTSSDILGIDQFTFLPVSSSSRDNRSHTFYVGVDQTFRRDLTGSVRVGAMYTDYYNDPSQDPTWNPYVDLSLSYTYMEGGTLTAGFHHGRNQTDQIVGGFGPFTQSNLIQDQESSTLYASVIHKITPKLTASATGQYQNSSFHGNGTFNGQTDNFFLAGLNLSYQFTHYLSAEVGYNYDDLSSDLPNRSYNRNRVYIGVTGSY